VGTTGRAFPKGEELKVTTPSAEIAFTPWDGRGNGSFSEPRPLQVQQMLKDRR
jgi:hypothetical protein